MVTADDSPGVVNPLRDRVQVTGIVQRCEIALL